MKKIFVILAAATALLVMGSCEKYEDGRPPKNAISTFESMYPDAFDVEWEYEGSYWEVGFETGSRPNGTEHEARFDLDGNWIWTKTEIFMQNVPQNIKDIFAASEYGNMLLADHEADHFQTSAGEFYRFDIRMEGRETEVDVYPDGRVTLAGLYY